MRGEVDRRRLGRGRVVAAPPQLRNLVATIRRHS
jgi:hypothetical protein